MEKCGLGMTLFAASSERGALQFGLLRVRNERICLFCANVCHDSAGRSRSDPSSEAMYVAHTAMTLIGIMLQYRDYKSTEVLRELRIFLRELVHGIGSHNSRTKSLNVTCDTSLEMGGCAQKGYAATVTLNGRNKMQNDSSHLREL